MKKSIYLFAMLIPFLISSCAYWSVGRTPEFGKSEGEVTTPHQTGWW
jgi:hypothetical protein